MKVLLISWVLLLLSVTTHAQESVYFTDFNKQDWIMQSTFVFVTCLDWAYTKQFRSEGIYELNPILGSEPTQEEVDTYMFTGIVAHTLVSYFLPKKYRPYWMGSFIITEVWAVNQSYRIGIRISGDF